MHCDTCGWDNLVGRRFCVACGRPLAVTCSHCAFENEPAAHFCGDCGRSLDDPPPLPASVPLPAPAAAGERRQAVVLFADLSGFSGLARRLDAESLHELMGHLFEVLDDLVILHGGTVDKHIGDCVMAIFGAPVSHGNEFARAIATARAMHAAMPTLSRESGQPLALHIGMAAGEVLAGRTGSLARSDYTVLGDVVNLAARLTDRARSGETLLSVDVARHALSEAVFEPLGELHLDGFAGTVPVFRLSDGDPAGRGVQPAPPKA